jgi:dGTPase
VEDVLAETARRLAKLAPVSVADVRNLPEAMVAFSPAMSEKERTLKDFLFRHMYRHEAVVAQTGRARVVVKQLFEMFIENPHELPPEWRRAASAPNSPETARIVADYIAGMTDQYALREHRQLIEKNS